MNTLSDTVSLGSTDICISPLGIGAWAWGDRMTWGFGRGYNEQDVQEAFQSSLAAGITFYDTAEVYGQGRSEKLLGQFLAASGQTAVVATKFFPYPWRLTKGTLPRALRGSLKRLGLEKVDLYQVHWPFPPAPVETWAAGLAEAVQAGLTRAVGVSNYNEEQIRRAYAVLARHSIPLASNQVEYHLLNRKVEFNGLLKACQEMKVSLIAYSPLAQGILTGKYSPEKPPPGIRGRRYNRELLEKVQPLVRQLRDTGRAHDGKTPAQVALNWLICKGTIPIPGAKNLRQAQDNAGALGWRLTEDEVAALDETSAKLHE